MTFLGFNKEDEIEEKEPLEAFAACFEFDLDIGPSIIGDLYTKIVTVGVIPNLMPSLRPPG